MPNDVMVSDREWPLTLAHNFLEAAQACGFVCDRVFVAPGVLVEQPPPGCACQLAATVVFGYEPLSDKASSSAAACGERVVATVTLVLDLCVVEPGQNAVKSPKEANIEGAEHVRALADIMRGLRTAQAAGHLIGTPWLPGVITPGAWVAVSQEGAMARWQTQWRYRQ